MPDSRTPNPALDERAGATAEPGVGAYVPPVDAATYAGLDHPSRAAHLAAFFFAYLGGAGLAQWLAVVPGTGISIWTPAGLYLASLMLTRRVYWPRLIVVAAVAELAANALWFGNAFPVALLLHAGNALCALGGAWLVQRFGNGPEQLETLRDVTVLVLLGGVVAPAFAATVGAATLAWWEGQPFENAWWLWWIGDATGVVLVAPLVLVGVQAWHDKAHIPPARLLEAAVIGAVLFGLAILSLDERVPFAYLAMPPVLWAAVRFQFRGAAVAVVGLTLLLALFTGAGVGPFAGDAATQEQKFVALQLFLASSALSALVVAALARQHALALRRLTAANDELEQRVAARTLALTRSEGRFRALADSVPIIVWVTDATGEIEFVNRAYERFTGLREAQVRATGWRGLVHPDDAPACFAAFDVAMREQSEFTFTARVRRADGAWRYLAVHAVPRTAADGVFLGMVGVSPDITQGREHEAALAEAARQKDEFLAMLAHELRNPLAPVRNAVELLRLAAGSDPAVERARTIIDRQVQHMVRLVDDLMDVSRVSRGKILLERVPVELAAVVRQALETQHAYIDQRRHKVDVVWPAAPLWVQGDFTRLAQAVGNVVNNAAKYSETAGAITIRIERSDDGDAPLARISVRDHGRGIDPAVMDSVFDMFFQAESTLDRAEGGLGIGLALVQRLVEMHGGTVLAASAGRGHGSEFTITLPLLRDAPAPRPAPTVAPAPSAASKRVLVVDDNQDAADSLSTLLRLDGHEVTTTYDGTSAVAIALRDEPDAVLLDLGLPGLDGYAACRAIRSGARRRMLLVALTGYGQDKDQRATAQAGFDAHCVKPADAAQLRALLARAPSPSPDCHA